jgi:uncharacterized SAM-binding protein YcdF (DUF218 family)
MVRPSLAMGAPNMLYDFSKIFEYVAEPGNLLVFLLTAGALLLAFGRRRSGGWLVGLATVAMLVLTIFPVGQWLIAPLEDRFPRAALPQRIDGIVLLGGAIRIAVSVAHDQPALNEMAARITETLALSRRYPDVPVVISGGDPAIFNRGVSEADITRSLLVSLGLDPHRIVAEERSRNTYENAVDSKENAKPVPGQAWVLVTSANHMPRAMGCFRQVGWDMLPDPVDYETSGSLVSLIYDRDEHVLDTALHEWIGLVAYRLLGRTDSFFPSPSSSASAR